MIVIEDECGILATIFECETCGQQFERRKDAEKHELFVCTQASCQNCRHMDNWNSRRYDPCPRVGLFGGNFAACAQYERATR